MSFSQEAKKEITEKEFHKGCCAKAAVYAVCCFGKYFDAKGLVLHTEKSNIAQYVKRLFSQCDIEGKVYATGKENSRIYEFAIKDANEIDKLFKLVKHSKNQISLHINSANLECERCISAFVSGAFLCVGTVTNPEREYNLEFVSNKHGLMNDFEALLKGHSFLPGKTMRKGSSVIYFKASEQIEDLLTFVGASGAAIEIMNQKVFKDFRNKANRITNCETANIDKMVIANSKTIEAIEFLVANKGLEALPETIKQAALMRMENPDLSLKELALLFEPPLSKSGLCHRIKKIEQSADALRERINNG